MHLILGVAIGLIGLLQLGLGGGLGGGLLGVVAAEILSLRRRLDTLEKKVPGQVPQGRESDGKIIFTPVSSAPAAPANGAAAKGWVPSPGRHPAADSGPSAVDRFFSGLGAKSSEMSEKIKEFFSTGNVVLKIGVIVLFFGVAFLLKYAAQRNLIPIELRLGGVALCAMILLGTGWRLRQCRPGYGLILQGGGVGILYLVVFGAAKLYSLLPPFLALTVMIGLVVLSCLLAVLQDARSLAASGIVGGFLAPVLMAADGGSHVLLFSYYGLLNGGIVGIAWARAWRELNLIGFVFTFVIGTLWGSSGYRPENFGSTEPFLLLFFVLYVLIAVLFARRQPIDLRGFIDGPLVFGLPLVVSGLQYYLVRDMAYGMAFSALGFGLLYLLLATLLRRRQIPSMHLLCEAFLATGVVFTTLAVPFALDGHWSSSIWALEGAGMVWVGAKQRRVLARHFGLLLQLAAAAIFVDSVWYPFAALPFANLYFLGCCFLALAALISSYFLDRFPDCLKRWERYYPQPLLVWGLLWWYLGGLWEVDKQLLPREAVSGMLLFCSAGAVLFGMAVRKLQWPRLALALLLQLPAMVLLAPAGLFAGHGRSHLFFGWGAVAWALAFVVQYRILRVFGGDWPKINEKIWHLGTLWVLLFVASHETAWGVGQFGGLAKVWSTICWALIPSGGLLLLISPAGQKAWPVASFRDSYLGPGGLVPAMSLGCWLVYSLSLAGDPPPLPYLPLVNPLDLSGILIVFTLSLWVLKCRRSDSAVSALAERVAFGGIGILLFLLLNSFVARSVHFFAGIPYVADSLYHSAIFQAAIAALWGSGALAITISATRRGRRLLWGIGAILLGMVVLKLFIVDLSGTGTIARIVSFLVVGVLMLIIGYFSPLPPKRMVERE